MTKQSSKICELEFFQMIFLFIMVKITFYGLTDPAYCHEKFGSNPFDKQYIGTITAGAVPVYSYR